MIRFSTFRLPVPTPRQSAILLLLVVVLQCMYNTTLPLSGDEAYYWVWSHHLQAGYYDHPPGIAVLIALTTRLAGDTVEGVRLAAVAGMAGAAVFLYLTAREMFGEGAAALTLILTLAVPAVQAGFTLATPDSPLVLFWAAGLYFARRAVAGPGLWRDFLLAGLAVGLDMASKYTALLLPMAVAAYLLARRRDLFASPRTWAAVAVALLTFSPVLWWNLEHGLKSFAFQYQHGSGRDWRVHWLGLGEFLGGQIVLLSPVLFALLVLRLARWRAWWSDGSRAFLVACFAVPAAVFLAKAPFAKIQLNWPAPIYLSMLPLIAGFLVERRMIKTGVVAVAVALALGAAMKWPLLFGLSGHLNPQNRLFGPDIAVNALAQQRRPGDALFADHLQRASLMSFLLPDHPQVHIPTPTRYSQYSQWDVGLDFHTMHGLYLSDSNRMADLQAAFGADKVTLLEAVSAMRPGFRSEHYFIYRVGTP